MIADDSRQLKIQEHEEGLFTEQQAGFLAMNMDNFQSYSDKITQALEESSQFTSFLNFDDVSYSSSNHYGSYARTSNTEFEELGREIANRIKEQAVILPTDTTQFDLHTIEEDALNEEDISVEKQEQQSSEGKDNWVNSSSQEDEQHQMKMDSQLADQDNSENMNAFNKEINCVQSDEHQEIKEESQIVYNSNGSEIKSSGIVETEEKENKNSIQVNKKSNTQEEKQETQQGNETKEVNKDIACLQNATTNGNSASAASTGSSNQIDLKRILQENVNRRTTADQLAQQWEQKDLTLAHFLALRQQQPQQLSNNINDQNRNVNYPNSTQLKYQIGQFPLQMSDQSKQKGGVVSYNYIQKQPGSPFQQSNYSSKIAALQSHKMPSQIFSSNSDNKPQSLHMVIQQHASSMTSLSRSIKGDVAKLQSQSKVIDLEVDFKPQNALTYPNKQPQNSQKNKAAQQLTPNKTASKDKDSKYFRLLELQKEKLKEEKAKYQRAQKQLQEEKLFSKASKTFHSSRSSNDTAIRQASLGSQIMIVNRTNKIPDNNDKNEYYLDCLNAQQGQSNNNNTNSSINSTQFEDCQGSGYLNSYKLKKKQQSLSNLSSKAVPVSPSQKKDRNTANPYQLTRKIESPQIGSKSPNHRSQQPLDLNLIKKITYELSSSAQRKCLEQEAIQAARAEREAKMLVQSGQVAEAINKMLLQANLQPPQAQAIHKQPKSAPAGVISHSNADTTPSAIGLAEKQEEKQSKLTKQRFQNVVSNFFTFHLNDQIPSKMLQPYEHLKINKHKQRAVLQLSENYGKQPDALEIKVAAQQHRPKSGRTSTSTSAQGMSSEINENFKKSKSFTQRSQQQQRNNPLISRNNNELISQTSNGSNNIHLKTLLL